MSGFETKMKYNPSLNYIQTQKVIFNDISEDEQGNIEKVKVGTLDGLKSQSLRLRANGGYNQQDRMIFDKRRSLDRALLYSYQSCLIKKVNCIDDIDNSEISPIHGLDEHEVCRALINPDKLKRDYDDKILSVHYEENFHAGDVFEWIGTNTYWMVYLQDLTERAYFRSEIRRCQYEMSWEDEDGIHTTYAAVRGPVETKIDYIQKHGISVDNPNYSLNILFPRNESTLKYFRRYAKFYLKDPEPGAPQVCWRIEAVDWISTPGIIEISAVEYYSNEFEDDIENGIAGGLIVKPQTPNDSETESLIAGETFIKPKQVYDFWFKGVPNGSWKISPDKAPVILGIDPNDSCHARIKWDETFSGQFTLCYGEFKKVIVVESLF